MRSRRNSTGSRSNSACSRSGGGRGADQRHRPASPRPEDEPARPGQALSRARLRQAPSPPSKSSSSSSKIAAPMPAASNSNTPRPCGRVGAVPTAVPPRKRIRGAGIPGQARSTSTWPSRTTTNSCGCSETRRSSSAIDHETEAFADYIDERVLWIQSGDVRPRRSRALPGHPRLGVCPNGWSGLAQRWPVSGLRTPGSIRSFIWRCSACSSVGPSRGGCRQFPCPTREKCSHQCAGSHLAHDPGPAGDRPGRLGWTGVCLLPGTSAGGSIQDSTEFARAVGSGFLHLAEWWLPLAVMAQLCRPQGLAESHFAWPTGRSGQYGCTSAGSRFLDCRWCF